MLIGGGSTLVSAGSGECTNGYVGPSGLPIFISQTIPGQPPQCNPNEANNELKPNRPFYELSIRHRAFVDGALGRREVRPGCVSYGQLRRYTVHADDEKAANLYVSLSRRVSHLLIRADVPPTLVTSDVSVTGMGTAASEPTRMSASASPCDPFRMRTWHIAVYLPERDVAERLGLQPTTYDLESMLTSARQELGSIITPRASGKQGCPSRTSLPFDPCMVFCIARVLQAVQVQCVAGKWPTLLSGCQIRIGLYEHA